MTIELTNDEQQLAQMWADEAAGKPLADEKAEGSTTDPEAGQQATTTETGDKPVDIVDDKAAPGEQQPATVEGDKKTNATDEIEVDFTPPAWVQLLPDDVRDQAVKDFRASRGSVKANAVRVQALTRHLEDARAKLAAAEQAGKQAPRIELPTDASLDDLKKDFPDLANWLEKSLNTLAQQTVRHNQDMLQPLKDAVNAQTNALAETINEATQQDREAARRQVLQVVPDAAEIARSEPFQQWLAAQSPGIQSMIRSTEPSDNITLFRLYKGSQPNPSDRLKDHAELPKKGGVVVTGSDDDVQDPLVFWGREFQKNKT